MARINVHSGAKRPDTGAKPMKLNLPARYWVSRDETAKGLADVVEFWSAKPICSRTPEEGAQWLGGETDDSGFATRIMLMRVADARKLHTVPDTSYELIMVGRD